MGLLRGSRISIAEREVRRAVAGLAGEHPINTAASPREPTYDNVQAAQEAPSRTCGSLMRPNRGPDYQSQSLAGCSCLRNFNNSS